MPPLPPLSLSQKHYELLPRPQPTIASNLYYYSNPLLASNVFFFFSSLNIEFRCWFQFFAFLLPHFTISLCLSFFFLSIFSTFFSIPLVRTYTSSRIVLYRLQYVTEDDGVQHWPQHKETWINGMVLLNSTQPGSLTLSFSFSPFTTAEWKLFLHILYIYNDFCNIINSVLLLLWLLSLLFCHAAAGPYAFFSAYSSAVTILFSF